MDEIKENDENINVSSFDPNEDMPLLKPKRKMRKLPRTEKQQEAFKKTMEKRALNVEKRKQQRRIDAAKLLLEVENREQETPKEDKVRTRKKIMVAITESDESDDSDDEEEEIIYKPIIHSRKKAPKKIYVMKKDDSDDEIPIIKQKAFKSQQNKKSVIKVSENINYTPNIKNYFCD
jgi:hypothetical protein